MRFSLVHKLASYLMTAAAFAAVTLSGEIHPLVTWAAALAGLGSWLWEPPRIRLERFEIYWNFLTGICFLYVLFDFLRPQGTLLTSGVHLLLFLLVNKLYNRRTSKDYQQLYVISFLLLVAGTTLNTDLSYALCFLAYVVFATWALTLFHLRREMEENYLLKHSGDEQSEKVEVERILNSRRIIGGSFLVGTSAVSLAVFLGALLIFFLFPRAGLGFFFARQRRGQAMSGFSDRIDLGMHGAIKNNPQVVMRIELGRPPGAHPVHAPERPGALHLRGVAFDAYLLGGQWLHTHAARRGLRLANGSAAIPGACAGEATGLLQQDIYLEPLSSRVLFGASCPVIVEVPPPIVGGRPLTTLLYTAEDEIYTSLDRPAGFRYTVESLIERPRESVLARIPDTPAPPELGRYLQLPQGLSPRIRALAQEIVRGAGGPFEKARSIESYLSHYRYTTDLLPPQGGDPLADFLFRTRAGHCEYFATAMAILLREAGVPTREVNGFYGGEWNDFGKYLAVRQMDAHAWVEVWFHDIGWVTFDPTPPGGATAPGAGGGLLNKLRQIEDSLELAWYKHMVEYNFDQQIEIVRSVRRMTDRLSVGNLASVRRRVGVVLLSGVGLGLLGLGARRLRRLRAAGRDRPGGAGRAADQPARTLYEKVLRRCARHGAERAPAETPLAFARGLLARGFPGAEVVDEATALYYRTRFGGETVDPAALVRIADNLDRIGASP